MDTVPSTILYSALDWLLPAVVTSIQPTPESLHDEMTPSLIPSSTSLCDYDPIDTFSPIKFRLRTLDEHRFATRFEAKSVTPQNWSHALRIALRKLRTGDRIHQVEALYVCLEVADLRPRGCDLAHIWLNIGSIYVMFHHLDEAVHAYHQCLHLDPTSWKAHFNLGIALARQRMFALAKSAFEHARICHCPPDTDARSQELVAAIDTIQSKRNEDAYKATSDARTFTWRYLETLHLLTTRERSNTSSVVTVNQSPSPTVPLLFDVASGWNGPMASLLHDLYVNAGLHDISLDEEYTRLDTAKTGCVPLTAFEALYRQVCDFDLSPVNKAALARVFSNNAVMVRILVPNSETLEVVEEMKLSGSFYSGMSWRLARKRLFRSKHSRSGGFWRWMDLSLDSWTEELVIRLHLSSKAIERLRGDLLKLGCPTPMHFVFRRNQSLDDFPRIRLGDQQLLVREIGSAVSEIREEACRVLQMFFRRLQLLKRKELIVFNRHKHDLTERRLVLIGVQQPVVTVREQQEIARCVLDTLDELVESVVSTIRTEAYARIVIPTGESPMRTENRHRLD